MTFSVIIAHHVQHNIPVLFVLLFMVVSQRFFAHVVKSSPVSELRIVQRISLLVSTRRLKSDLK